MKKSIFILLLVTILIDFSYSQISSNCTKPIGNNCDWYASCLLPETPNCPFIIDTMQKKCEQFESIEPSFSPLGKSWLDNVRVCIQDKLAQTFLPNASPLDCSTVTNSFFGDHPGCYFNGTISFCQLTFKEQVEVAINGADMIFSKNILDILEIANEIRKYCY